MKTLKDERTLVEIMQNFSDREREAVKAYGLALIHGKTPEEAFEIGEAVRTGKQN